jgi:hypothetical protein
MQKTGDGDRSQKTGVRGSLRGTDPPQKSSTHSSLCSALLFLMPKSRFPAGLYRFRGCKGLQPSKSETTIGALIKTWRASGPSAPCWAMQALFCRSKACVQSWTSVGSAAARGCSPPGQARLLGLLIKTWRAPVPRRRAGQRRVSRTSFALLLDLRPRRQRKTGAGHEE